MKQLRRQGRIKYEPVAGPRVVKFQALCVQKMPLQAANRLPDKGIEQIPGAIPAIEEVSHYWVADLCEVDPDLVGPAGFDPDPEEGKRSMLGFKSVVSNGIATPAGVNRDFLSIPKVAAQWQIDGSRTQGRASIHQGKIFLSDSAVFELH
jgi:hypothetical protein